MLLSGYSDISLPGAMGWPFKRDIGGRPLQRHATSDWWRDAARVPGLPEPADRAVAPETQEEQLREQKSLRLSEWLTGEQINYGHTHTDTSVCITHKHIRQCVLT